MVAVTESGDRIGFVGPKVYFYDRPDVIQYTGGGDIDRFRGILPGA